MPDKEFKIIIPKMPRELEFNKIRKSIKCSTEIENKKEPNKIWS